jgi:hypothetical protein
LKEHQELPHLNKDDLVLSSVFDFKRANNNSWSAKWFKRSTSATQKLIFSDIPQDFGFLSIPSVPNNRQRSS